MKRILRYALLGFIVGILLIIALAICAYIVDASESHATWLPLVLDTGGELHEDPCPPAWQVGGGCLPPAVTPPPTPGGTGAYPPTPTMAPTVCPGYFETGVCDPTPTPFVVTVEP